MAAMLLRGRPGERVTSYGRVTNARVTSYGRWTDARATRQQKADLLRVGFP